MFAYVLKEGNSNQAWLGTVAFCECCHSQQPKAEFKIVNGEELCGKCQKQEEFA